MRSTYKKLRPYIREVDVRNVEDRKTNLLGVSTQKVFIDSIANTVGTNFTKYKVVRRGQFTYVPDTSRRGDRIGLALLETHDWGLVSNVYTVFEVIDEDELLPEYLMMWFRRPEFDRYARFKSHGSVRELFGWDEMCDVELPIPSIEKQREIVKEYQTVVDRIRLNERLNEKLEEAAQAIYKQWFVDFEFPMTAEYAKSIGKPELAGQPYKSNGGEMEYNEVLEQEIPKGWKDSTFGEHGHVVMGQSPKGESYNVDRVGIPLVNGPVEFGPYYTEQTKWTTAPTKQCERGDLIVCVRGSTTGRHVKSDGVYCIGRGVCSVRAKDSQRFVDQMYFAIRDRLLSFTTGSTFPNWSSDEICGFPTVGPPSPLIKRFDDVLTPIVEALEKKHSENRLLQRMANLFYPRMAQARNG